MDIDLSGLPDEKFRGLASLFILQTLKEKMRFEGWSESKGLKTLVVLDEAWKIASDDRSDAITIVREGRKYQFGLIVASQNPTDINEAIFSNVGTTFILRIKFEKFLNYIQGTINFSNFIREEISNFGVGQAAVEMAFQTALRFPQTFILEKIQGETPLYVYTVNMEGAISESELSSNVIQRDYQFEREELRNKLIEYNVSAEGIDSIFSSMDEAGRNLKMLDFINVLFQNGVEASDIVLLLKSMSIEDSIITRIIAKAGVRNA